MSPVTNPFTAPRQAGQEMAEKAKESKEKMTGDSARKGSDSSSSAIDEPGSASKAGGQQRPRTLSSEDMDKMAPEQMFRTSLGEHGEMIQDEPSPSMTKKGMKDEEDDLDLYDAMTAE